MHADGSMRYCGTLTSRAKTIIVIEHHTEYIADYCKHVLLMKDGQVQWMLPTGEALQRVEELEACNIFPPQVTQAAYRLKSEGSLAALDRLPTTVEEANRPLPLCPSIPLLPAPNQSRKRNRLSPSQT